MSTTTSTAKPRGRAAKRQPTKDTINRRSGEEREARRAALGVEQREPEAPSALDELGLRLAAMLYPSSGEVNVGTGSSPGSAAAPSPLTLEEVSMLLQERERLGAQSGYQDGQREARRWFAVRSQRDRAESVAGALLFCVETLAPVIDRLAVDGVSEPELYKAARLELVELVAAMSRHAQRIADGDEQLSL